MIGLALAAIIYVGPGCCTLVERALGIVMSSNTLDNLILDLLEWVEFRERTYEETLNAWRTACPRFPIWEDASDRGLVETISENGHVIVRVTPRGRVLLRESRPPTPPRQASTTG